MKRILTILLAAMLALSVTACKPRDDNGSSSGTSSSQVSSTDTKESDEAKSALEKTLKSQYGKDAKLKYMEKKEIQGKKYFVFDLSSSVVSNAVFAISEDHTTYLQKEMGSGEFLPVEPVHTPAKYLIDLLQSDYAGKLVSDINAVAGQIKGGTYKDYPTEFPDKSSFPKISDTEQLIYCYSESAFLDENYNDKKLITIVLPIDETHAMLVNPTMAKGDGEAKSLALTNFKFESNFNLEKFAKDNGLEILKGSMVK